MEEILSQEEIDLLIQASRQTAEEDTVSQLAEEAATESRPYDFSRPNKFSKEHMRALQRIHEQFCRTYSGLMAAKLRTRLELKVNSIEQLTFGEFVRSLPNPSVLTVLEALPLENHLVVQMTPDTAFVLHDRLCGGPGRPMDRARGLSEIELAVLRRQVVAIICQLLEDAWSEVTELQFKLDHIENNPQFLQVAADRDVSVLISLSLELGSLHDMFNICIPFRTIEPVVSRLTQARLFESLRSPDPEKLKQLRAKVSNTILPLEVELGKVDVTVDDLLSLEIGDVITLDTKRNENLDIKVGRVSKYRGSPGKLGGRYGVVITSIQDEGDDEHE